MSMIGNYLLVNEKIIQGIRSGKICISDYLYNTKHEEDEYLDIDKSWHAIHYILCHHPWEGDIPLFNVVLGGTIINDEDVGNGPARYLTPVEIKDAHEAIKNITEEEFRKRFDLKELADNDIYPQLDNNDDIEYVWSYFSLVQSLFEKATLDRKYMLLYIN